MRRSQTMSAMLTPSASATKNQRCHPPACASMLNAAPVFSRYTMSSIGSSSIVSLNRTVLITSAFVA